METFLLETKQVKRVFGNGSGAVTALQDVSIKVPKGRLLVLKGRSGSGKTTLLNLLGGLDRPTEGEVYFEQKVLSNMSETARTELRRRRIGFIFQSFGLVPLLSAAENVEFGLRLAGVARSEWQSRTAEALELVGLGKRGSHRPFEMSGGEQQRCAIARALAARPPLILADEPTAELDTRTGSKIVALFREWIAKEGVTILMTTHDPAIMEAADDVYELEDGRIKGGNIDEAKR
ncbi:ABC transporter ATP-binding protein [Brevibacillus fluminis]|uniref:ABC transporter ATP-binding protein n=1 Tax=Brevibacillus fluminis TaxID=511487 RepID=UPI003F88EFB9